MNITEFAMLKKMLGKGGGGGGGVANVGTSETWVFKDKLTPIGNYEGVDLYFDFLAYHPEVGRFVKMNELIVFDWDEENGGGTSVSYLGFEYNYDDAYNGDEWVLEQLKTITILETPTDEAFIAWLNANATQINIAGTWLFNETIELPSKNFEVSFVASDNTAYCVMEPDDEGWLYYSTEVGDQTSPAFYNGWENEIYRTITIIEDPTDAEFIKWLKVNAKKVGNLNVYNAHSIYELPGDASAGSVAIVDIDNIVGEWYFNEQLSQIPNFGDGDGKEIKLFCICEYYGGVLLPYNTLRLWGDADTLVEIEYCLVAGEQAPFEHSRYTNGWEGHEERRTHKILENPTDPVVREWVRANATRLTGAGKSYFVRGTDDWEHFGEIV